MPPQEGITVLTALMHDVDQISELFGDVLPSESQGEEIGLSPELESYDTYINHARGRELGELVFLYWLRARLTQRPVLFPEPLGSSPCSADPDMFFPDEYPDSEGYPLQEEDSEYLKAYYAIHTQVVTAKRACTGCAFKDQCLAASVVNFQEYGIWGGWGEGGRARIFNQFNRLRRDYQNGRVTKPRMKQLEQAAFALV